MMTTITTLIALLPVLFATGRGADVARAMALPVFGGMLIEPFSSFIVPTLYCAYMEFKLRAGLRDELLEMSLDETTPGDANGRRSLDEKTHWMFEFSVPFLKGVEK